MALYSGKPNNILQSFVWTYILLSCTSLCIMIPPTGFLYRPGGHPSDLYSFPLPSLWHWNKKLDLQNTLTTRCTWSCVNLFGILHGSHYICKMWTHKRSNDRKIWVISLHSDYICIKRNITVYLTQTPTAAFICISWSTRRRLCNLCSGFTNTWTCTNGRPLLHVTWTNSLECADALQEVNTILNLRCICAPQDMHVTCRALCKCHYTLSPACWVDSLKVVNMYCTLITIRLASHTCLGMH